MPVTQKISPVGNADECIRFAELLSSRLCHDLITPVGAINTGLELLAEQPSLTSPDTQEILDLIESSAKTSSTRLSFYRAAFGSSGATVSLGDSQKLIDKFFEKSKLTFHWPVDVNSTLAMRNWGRLLMNGILWVNECAPRGGDIKFTLPSLEERVLKIELESPHIIFHEGMVESLRGEIPVSEMSPRTVQSYLIKLIADLERCTISLDHKSQQSLVLKVSAT